MASMKLYVGNLAHQTSQTALEELFAAYGEVQSAIIITDRETGQSRGFGFVEMADRAAAEKAMAEINGKDVDGRQLKVNEAKPKTDDRGGRGGRGGGGGGWGRDRY